MTTTTRLVSRTQTVETPCRKQVLLAHQADGLTDQEDEQTNSWDTATHGERKDMLSRCRRQNPVAALELLRKDWKGEPANHRNELLEAFGRTAANPTSHSYRK